MNKYQEALNRLNQDERYQQGDEKMILRELVDRATPMEVTGVECPECEAEICFQMGLPYFCWKCGQAFIREDDHE